MPFYKDRKNTYYAVIYYLCLKNVVGFHILKCQPNLKSLIFGTNSELGNLQESSLPFLMANMSSFKVQKILIGK